LERCSPLTVVTVPTRCEATLAARYPRSKRFGLEGAEALAPALHALLRRASALGAVHVDLGMAHRGRLNVLVSLFGKVI
jgi:2-oxoglutarate dehydrogenase E1 component